jgi:hypothetical protein
MKNFLLKIIIFINIFSSLVFAQNEVKGKIENWELGKQDIIVGLRDITTIGEVDDNGNIIIPLPNNYLEIQKEKMADMN